MTRIEWVNYSDVMSFIGGMENGSCQNVDDHSNEQTKKTT